MWIKKVNCWPKWLDRFGFGFSLQRSGLISCDIEELEVVWHGLVNSVVKIERYHTLLLFYLFKKSLTLGSMAQGRLSKILIDNIIFIIYLRITYIFLASKLFHCTCTRVDFVFPSVLMIWNWNSLQMCLVNEIFLCRIDKTHIFQSNR